MVMPMFLANPIGIKKLKNVNEKTTYIEFKQISILI